MSGIAELYKTEGPLCICGHEQSLHIQGAQDCCVNVGNFVTGTVTGCGCPGFQTIQPAAVRRPQPPATN